MTIISATVGKNPLEKWSSFHSQKESKMQYLDGKMTVISVLFQDKPFNTTVVQVFAPTNNAEEAEAERFYEDLQDF